MKDYFPESSSQDMAKYMVRSAFICECCERMGEPQVWLLPSSTFNDIALKSDVVGGPRPEHSQMLSITTLWFPGEPAVIHLPTHARPHATVGLLLIFTAFTFGTTYSLIRSANSCSVYMKC